MVLDSSAMVAIMFDEPERATFTLAVERDPKRLISAASLLESALIVEARRGEAAGRELDLLIHRAEIAVLPVDREQVEIARYAWRRFGKGRHQAALNFGDCFAYALSAASGEPLLFKGEDFSHTDVQAVRIEVPETPETTEAQDRAGSSASDSPADSSEPPAAPFDA